jgi:hypothetical protein
MTPTQRATIPLIVRALTPPQRRHLLWLTDEWQDQPAGAIWRLQMRKFAPDGFVRLAECAPPTMVDGMVSRQWRLTSLGRMVRDAVRVADAP